MKKVYEKPEIAKKNNYVNELYKGMTKKSDKDLIKVVIISDIHLDYSYTEGMSNECGTVMCCRPDSGLPTNPS